MKKNDILSNEETEETTKRKKVTYYCDKCDLTFKTKSQLSKHEKQHKNSSGEFKCRICGAIFESIELREKHRNTSHKVFRCFICNIKFGDESSFIIHTEKFHDGRHKEFEICNDCGRQYSTKAQLAVHLASKCGTQRNFNCEECGAKLMTANALYHHQLRHSGTRTYMCRFCAKTFLTGGELIVHERIHTNEKAFVCEICNKGFCHRQSLITHFTIHTGIKPFQCEGCSRSFSCVGNLLKHRKSHANSCGKTPLTTHSVQHPSTRAKILANTPKGIKLRKRKREINLTSALNQQEKTEQTELEIDSSSSRQTLLTISETNNPELDYNEICEVEMTDDLLKKETNTDLSGLNSKEIEILNENEKSYWCYEEMNSTESEFDDNIPIETLDSDLLSENSTDCLAQLNTGNVKEQEDANAENMPENSDKSKSNNIKCRYCGIAYGRVGWLQKHEKWHENGGNSKKNKSKTLSSNFKCSICKLIFESIEEKIKHQSESHTDKLECNVCKKVLATPHSKRTHMLHYHMRVPRKMYTYVCDKCGKTLSSKGAMQVHEKSNCGQGKLYKCNQCEKMFASKHSLKTHSKVHENVKAQLCKFCGKSFLWKGQLKIHERRHNGEKPYQCQFCPKSFAYRESLITHNSLHTGVKPHLCHGCGSRFSCIGNLVKHRRTHSTTCGKILPDSNTGSCFKGLNMQGVKLKQTVNIENVNEIKVKDL